MIAIISKDFKGTEFNTECFWNGSGAVTYHDGVEFVTVRSTAKKKIQTVIDELLEEELLPILVAFGEDKEVNLLAPYGDEVLHFVEFDNKKKLKEFRNTIAPSLTLENMRDDTERDLIGAYCDYAPQVMVAFEKEEVRVVSMIKEKWKKADDIYYSKEVTKTGVVTTYQMCSMCGVLDSVTYTYDGNKEVLVCWDCLDAHEGYNSSGWRH